jgi:diguanylate cyclase (GGDEF)-like protein
MPTYAQPAWPNRAAVLAGLAAALIGVLALIGWYADLPLLTTGLPGHPPMIPNTALAFLAAGLALAGNCRRWRPVSYGLAMLVVVLGVVTLVEWILDTSLGFDTALLPDHGADAQDQLRAAEERYRHLAEHDPLTGLWNRRRFEQELDAHLALCRDRGPRGALLSLDLDHFKIVNDTYGHHAGDGLLAALATAMDDALGTEDGIARQGGDEFLVLLRTGDEADATRVAHVLIEAVRRTTAALADRVGPEVATVSASAGVVVFDQLAPAELAPEPVLIHADHALYDAKSSGRGQPRLAAPTRSDL